MLLWRSLGRSIEHMGGHLIVSVLGGRAESDRVGHACTEFVCLVGACRGMRGHMALQRVQAPCSDHALRGAAGRAQRRGLHYPLRGHNPL